MRILTPAAVLLLLLGVAPVAAQEVPADPPPAEPAPDEVDLPVARTRWKVGDTVTWTAEETATEVNEVIGKDGTSVRMRDVTTTRHWKVVIRAAAVDADGRRTRTQVLFEEWRSETRQKGALRQGEDASEVDESLTGAVVAVEGAQVTHLAHPTEPSAAADSWFRERFLATPAMDDAADPGAALSVPARAAVGATWKPDIEELLRITFRGSPFTVDSGTSTAECELLGVDEDTDGIAVARVRLTAVYVLTEIHFRPEVPSATLSDDARARITTVYRFPLSGRLRPLGGETDVALAGTADLRSKLRFESTTRSNVRVRPGGEIPGLDELENPATPPR